MKIQEKSESFYFFPEICCIRSHYLDVRIFRYSDIYSDIYNIYNIYSPPKFWRICSCSCLSSPMLQTNQRVDEMEEGEPMFSNTIALTLHISPIVIISSNTHLHERLGVISGIILAIISIIWRSATAWSRGSTC